MKNLFAIWVVLVITLLTSFGAQAATIDKENKSEKQHTVVESATWGNKRITGSGNIIEKETKLSGKYSTIYVSRGVNVIMENRSNDKVIISADDNVMEYVICKVEGGKLTATIDSKINSISNVNVKIYLPKSDKIDKISTSSAGEAHIYPSIKSPSLAIESSSGSKVEITTAEVGKLAINVSSAGWIKGSFKSESSANLAASSAGKIDITLLGKEVKCDASSGADIKLNGQAIKLNAEASSAANIEAETFVVENVNAEASSGGDVDVFVQKQLNASASSGGGVRYKGPVPTVSKSTSSGGRVKEM
ncbi:MAG: DUF2807 domain-containing protein [Alistipes sp.]|nr:DUF2807 domain-containing protein [Alistipes sp.]